MFYFAVLDYNKGVKSKTFPYGGHLTVGAENTENIAFARGGAQLPIAHALRLPKTDIILLGRVFLDSFSFGGFFWRGGRFFEVFWW